MKPRLKFAGLLVVLLASGICFGLLYSHWRRNCAKIAGLEQKLAALNSVRAENQALQPILAELQELQDLRNSSAALFRLRKEVGALQGLVEKRRLAATRSMEAQVAQLQTENLQLRSENQELEKAPVTVAARQAVDVGELTQIAAAIGLYAKMNDNNLPAHFADLKSYTTADVFPNLETNRFEFLLQGKLTDIANPVSTPLVRAKAKDGQNQRPYLFADGHLEIRED
jgi:hypothetical protein